MKKRLRFTILMLAAALAYFASEGTSKASLCEPGCWDNWGQICCTTAECIDFCW